MAAGGSSTPPATPPITSIDTHCLPAHGLTGWVRTWNRGLAWHKVSKATSHRLPRILGTNAQMGLAVRMWQGQCQTPAAGGSYLISNKLITAFAGPGLGSNQGSVGAYNNGLVLDVTGY